MAEQVSFSPWTQWAKRHSLESEQGIYLWARFIQDAPLETLPADPFHKDVIYVGESCKGKSCFKERWHLFDKGLSYLEEVQADPNHNDYSEKDIRRARRYYKLFGTTDREHLYVATLTSKALSEAFIGLKSSDLLDIAVIPSSVQMNFSETIDDLLVRYLERRLILLYARQNGHRPLINNE